MKFEIKEYNYLGFDLKNKTRGRIKTVCPHCSDTRKKKDDPCVSVDIDNGLYYCHHCGMNGSIHKYKKITNNGFVTPKYDYDRNINIGNNVIAYFETRGISTRTLSLLRIEEETIFFPQIKKDRNAIVFPYFKNGVCINKKFRDGKKNFLLVKDAEKTFYNLDSIQFSETMIIHEGEIDVMSSIECGLYDTVSVPNGATMGNINLDFIEPIYDSHISNKKKIILAGDNDEPGRNLMNKLAERLGKHRCFTVNWGDCKDSNEYLIKHGKEEYLLAIKNAEPIPIEGVYSIRSCEKELFNELRNGVIKGDTCRIKSLEKHFSWCKRDVYVFAGYANMGKTEFVYNLAMLKSMWDGWKWGIAGLEEKTTDRFYRKLVEMYVGKRIDPEHKNYGNQMSEQELKKAIKFIDKHFFFVKPSDKFSKNNIFDLFEYTDAKHGLDGIIIDPFNKIVKDVTSGLRDDELLVRFYTDLERFNIEHNVCGVTITHMNKPQNIKDGVPSRPTQYDILGGQGTNNAVDQIVFVHSETKDRLDPNRTIIVAKVRDRDIVGYPGECNLSFDYRKRRFLDNGNDPFIGYESNNIKEEQRLWLPYKDDDDLDVIDYIPF
ncbi:MAG: toprim domain-containing protein [Bacteroidales bacterium]|nr:toprim domain-containing protein [Bacteroidales bacterium]